MTQPPEGWSTPGGPAPEPPPSYGYGYGPPAPPGYPPPPPAAAPPPWAQPGWGQPGFGAPVVTPGVVPLRPLTLGELLDGAVKVVRRYPRPTLAMSGILALVTTVLNVLAVLAEDYSSFADDLSTEGSSSDPVVGGNLASLPAGLVGMLAGIVLTGFLVAVVGKAVLGHPTTFGEVWKQVRGRVLALVGLALLTGLLVVTPIAVAVLLAVLLALGSPVLLVLGIPLVLAAVAFGTYLYVRLSLAPAVLVLERAGIRTSMTRSGVLVKGDWWRVFGILLLVQVIISFVSSVLTVPFLVVAGINAFANPDAGSFTLLFVVSQLGAGLATLLVAPFAAAARGLLYVDRRMRAEGLDLTLQAAARG